MEHGAAQLHIFFVIPVGCFVLGLIEGLAPEVLYTDHPPTASHLNANVVLGIRYNVYRAGFSTAVARGTGRIFLFLHKTSPNQTVDVGRDRGHRQSQLLSNIRAFDGTVKIDHLENGRLVQLLDT